MIPSIMRVVVGRIAREHGGEVLAGRPGCKRYRYLGVDAPSDEAAERIARDGERAGLGAAQWSAGPDLGFVVWWEGSKL